MYLCCLRRKCSCDSKVKKKNWSKIDNKCKKEELFCKEINCKLHQIQRSRYTIAFHRWEKTVATLHQSCFNVEIMPCCLLGSGQRPNLCIYLLSCVHGLHIINGSKSFTLSQMIRYVRTTWYDLFVLSQHEGNNRIHTICSKSVL